MCLLPIGVSMIWLCVFVTDRGVHDLVVCLLPIGVSMIWLCVFVTDRRGFGDGDTQREVIE